MRNLSLSEDDLKQLGNLINLGMCAAAAQVSQNGLSAPAPLLALITIAPVLADKVAAAIKAEDKEGERCPSPSPSTSPHGA